MYRIVVRRKPIGEALRAIKGFFGIRRSGNFYLIYFNHKPSKAEIASILESFKNFGVFELVEIKKLGEKTQVGLEEFKER